MSLRKREKISKTCLYNIPISMHVIKFAYCAKLRSRVLAELNISLGIKIIRVWLNANLKTNYHTYS